MSSGEGIREKIKRKLSMHDKNPEFSNDHTEDDIDEETTGHLHREIERSEAAGQDQGRPGSFLNRLISHGNEKTEREIAQGSGTGAVPTTQQDKPNVIQ